MNSEEIMKLALKLAELKTVPKDSAIYVKGRNIRKVFFGIDAKAPELSLAKQLGYDAVVAHHPAGGTAIVEYHQVFKRHAEQMTNAGIPRKKAQSIIQKKLKQMEVEGHMQNYKHAVDVARMLKMAYMNIHTPLDEIGRRIMSQQVQERIKRKATVGDVAAALNSLPEFKNAKTKIKIRLGKAENPAGKVVVSHGAGTNGGYEIAKAYFEHGVRTVIYIHISPADLERLKAEVQGNLIITGHVASDSVGINPFLHELRNSGIEVATIGVVPDQRRTRR